MVCFRKYVLHFIVSWRCYVYSVLCIKTLAQNKNQDKKEGNLSFVMVQIM